LGVKHFLSFATLTNRRPHRPLGGVLPIVGLIFGLGLVAGAILRPPLVPYAATVASGDRWMSHNRHVSSAFDPELTYAVEVVRVIDGDTFVARVRVLPGIDVDTKIRLRSIDAPELHARCAIEYVKAEAARVALQSMLAVGGVTVSHVGADKYRGRIDADVTTRDTPDVSSAMLKGGWARRYDGGRRGSWCW
jgi:endonuclease YncB( thermonuclease family)